MVSFSPLALKSWAAPSWALLKRLHVVGDAWLDQVQHFGRWFRRAVGRATTLADAAAQRGRRWLHGIARSRQAFE